jgi:hypothetical protein
MRGHCGGPLCCPAPGGTRAESFSVTTVTVRPLISHEKYGLVVQSMLCGRRHLRSWHRASGVLSAGSYTCT